MRQLHCLWTQIGAENRCSNEGMDFTAKQSYAQTPVAPHMSQEFRISNFSEPHFLPVRLRTVTSFWSGCDDEVSNKESVSNNAWHMTIHHVLYSTHRVSQVLD